jgi:Kef-type K+ transport system membrane component KefB/mannitol/fructose-specific phosphotransferase system IIA component (Ntr-type)
MTSQNIVVMLLSLGILLGVAHILGELAQRMGQPSILGELLAGVLLGPTVLGMLAPGFMVFLFPMEGPNAVALEAVTSLSIVLFLLVAGMEVDLSMVWKQGRVGIKVGLISLVLPFIIGFAVAMVLPRVMGRHSEADPIVFALFFATALAISALPIIAKTLMDMGLYRSDFGMLVISAAIFNDIVGWLIFAIILSLMGVSSGHSNPILMTIGLTLAFAAAILTLGRWLIHKILPILQAYTQWPAGVLGFAVTLALLGAAFTQWIGVHAIFGSFFVGVAMGDSYHLRERTRTTIKHFASFIFAPLFFASIGLRVNFFTHFDLFLVLAVLAISCTAKLVGGMLGARWGGMQKKEAWAVGFAMNSQGAMGIILGLLALNFGVISRRLFVALVIMAIVSSMMSGPMVRLILKPARKRRLGDALSNKLFLRNLTAATPRNAIHEMAMAAAGVAGMNGEVLEGNIWEREETLSTGIGKGVALPHARIQGLQKPVVAVGISDTGIDFDAPDDKLAHVIFLVLTPQNDFSAQLEFASEIAKLFQDPGMLERVLKAKTYTDFLSAIKSNPGE